MHRPTLTDADRDDLSKNEGNNPLTTSHLPSYQQLKRKENVKEGERFVGVSTLSSSNANLTIFGVFNFPPTDQGMELDVDGVLKRKDGIVINATMFAFFNSLAHTISRQYGFGMRDAWMVATQSVAVGNAYPYTLKSDFASDNPKEFKRKQEEKAETIKEYLQDACAIGNFSQVMVFGGNALEFVKKHNVFPPEMIAQPGSVLHLSKAVKGATNREAHEFYASTNITLARTLNEPPRPFELSDPRSLFWTRPMSENFANGGCDDYIYKLWNSNGEELFRSQNRTALHADLRGMHVSFDNKDVPTQKEILDKSRTTVLGLKITLVSYKDYNYGDPSQSFGPRESPALKEWKDSLISGNDKRGNALRGASKKSEDHNISPNIMNMSGVFVSV